MEYLENSICYNNSNKQVKNDDIFYFFPVLTLAANPKFWDGIMLFEDSVVASSGWGIVDPKELKLLNGFGVGSGGNGMLLVRTVVGITTGTGVGFATGTVVGMTTGTFAGITTGTVGGITMGIFSSFFAGETGLHSSPFLWCWPLLTGNCILNSVVLSKELLIGKGTEF